MPIAITRDISDSIANCELTHQERAPIDLELARAQHEAYKKALKSAGCDLIELPARHDLPDAVFVEDTAVILDEAAIITNPGAVSRQPEIDSIAETLRPFRKLIYIQPPATIDGGDVLVLGKKIYTGLSSRSSLEAVNQMQSALGVFGYRVIPVEVRDCLHLKSAVTAVSPDTLLINPDRVDRNNFAGMNIIEIDESEPDAANGLLIGETLIYPKSFPKTLKRLAENGLKPLLVDAGELAKAEGAVTCCSLLIN